MKVCFALTPSKNPCLHGKHNKSSLKQSKSISFSGEFDELFEQVDKSAKIPFTDNNVPTDPEVSKVRLEFDKYLYEKKLGLPAYFEDGVTKRIFETFSKKFGTNVIEFVPTGTAANVLALKSINPRYLSVIASDKSHIVCNENLAPQLNGIYTIQIPSNDGKITVNQIKEHIEGKTSGTGFCHHPPAPKVVFITQPTELGYVYTPNEIKEIADFAHLYHMDLVMDGARLPNAAASLRVSLEDLTWNPGVDVLSLGLTKNGASGGSAVIFIKNALAKWVMKENHPTDDYNLHIIKNSGWMIDKGWYPPLEYYVLLKNNRCIENAKHANKMAKIMGEQITNECSSFAKVINQVQTNALFVKVNASTEAIKTLMDKYSFYIWEKIGKGEKANIIRLMTTFITDVEAHIKPFISDLKRICGK